jgi:cell division cycle 2-like protein
MATCNKRPAAVDRPGATTCRKRRRVLGTTAHYDTEARLGEGMYGVVVKARHRATGKAVAIKSLCNPFNEHEPADAREVLREARFLEACGGHPNIVGFRGVVRDYVTDELCLVMEHVQGKSLHRLLRESRGGLPENTARGFMWQLLAAARRMHACHVVHRDLKPANIIVSGEEEEGITNLKICDFGAALSLSEAPPYENAGTGWYRAPEMLLGFCIHDALVDTWSLGCVMAEILSGERLFQADGSVSLLRRIFEVVGAPDDTAWPGFTSREFAPEVQQVLTGQRSTLRDIFPEEKLSNEGFDLLSGLLTCNPDKRFTAAAALKLPWFASVAANAQPLLLPAAAATTTPAVSIKEEEVETAPSTLRRKRVTARKSMLPVKKKTQLIVPPAT